MAGVSTFLCGRDAWASDELVSALQQEGVAVVGRARYQLLASRLFRERRPELVVCEPDWLPLMRRMRPNVAHFSRIVVVAKSTAEAERCLKMGVTACVLAVPDPSELARAIAAAIS